IDAPAGVKPIEWRLLTNRRAETLEAAVELVEWYRARWEIELLFLALKVGCRVEALQLSTLQRLERTLIISWRIARLKHLGRTSPELDASGVFEAEEWQAAYLLAK
ncbi:transposase, partial [Allochromatium humboldtianum]